MGGDSFGGSTPSIHWLLIAMPVAAALDAIGAAAPLVFFCAALAFYLILAAMFYLIPA